MIKKKRSTGKTLLIAGGALAAGYAIYEFVIKPRTSGGGNQNVLDVPPGFTPGSGGMDPALNLIDTVNQAPVNQAPVLSPKGTADNALQYDILLKKGDRGGEIEKLQKISNVISRINKTKVLQVDGIFGNLTQDKVTRQMGVQKITLRQALRQKNAYEAWNKAGKKGKVTDYLK
jgi:hypothetical protein